MLRLCFFFCAVVWNSVSHASQTFYSLNTERERLGAGFESQYGVALDGCLMGDTVFHSGSQARLNYNANLTDNTFIDSIIGSVKGSVNLIIFGGSAKFSMKKRVTKNYKNISSVIKLSYIKGNYSLENRRLKPEVEAVLMESPERIRALCGDGFIHNVTLGSNLYLSAKLHFKSIDDYRWYQTKIKIKFAFWSKTKTKTKVSHRLSESAVYSIQVNADGGLTPKLYEITQGKPVYCKVNDMDNCYNTINQLFTYLFAQGNYEKDLTNDYLNTIKYEVERYEDSGHYGLAFSGGDRFDGRYVTLSERLRQYQNFVDDFLEDLYAFKAVAISETEIDELNKKISDRVSEKKRLKEASDYCSRLPSYSLCEQRVEEAIDQVAQG